MKIISIKDSIVIVQGDKNHFIDQMVEFDGNQIGLVLKASKSKTFIVVDEPELITIKSKYKMLDKKWEVEAMTSMFGSVMDVYGNVVYPLENNKKGKSIGKSFAEQKAPMFYDREKLNEPLETGIFSIDSLIPIGKGQRELIIGDRRTGKTSLTLSTIINQKNKDIKVIYVSIGQKQTSINSVYKILEDHDSMNFTSIIMAEPSKKLSLYLAPYVGMAYAEVLQRKGEDVLIILDDLSKHANIHRELSLNLDKPGGREAYPSDLFYSHSRLLERAGKFKDDIGGGTITCLPIIETVEGDFSTLLATNVISITDGQIFTDTSLAKEGKYPSINIGNSVSRTGSSVQSKELKSISKTISKIHSKYIESSKYELISLEVSEDIKENIKKGQALVKSFEQPGYIGRTRKEISLIAQMIEWGAFSSNKETPETLINFAKKDSIGKKIIAQYNEDSSMDIKLISSYFKSLYGEENEYGAKRAPIEIEILKGENNG